MSKDAAPSKVDKIIDAHEHMNYGPAQMTHDSLINAISGLNTERDRNAAAQFCRTNSFGQNYTELEAMYTENWIAKKAINLVAEDMTREWVTFENISPEEIKKIQAEEKRLQLRSKVTDAVRWARMYGGCMIMPIFKGKAAESLSTPLDISTIRPGDLESLNVIEARYVFPTSLVEINPANPAYQTPEFYTVAGAPEFIHHSRLVRVNGDPLPRWERQQHRYWGQSVLESARKAVVEAFTASGLISSMLSEANLDVISIENLSAALAAGKEGIKERFAALYRFKSMFNVTLLDSKEVYGQRQINFSNLDKIMEMFYVIVSGAFNLPVTKLLGVSPAGLNATGEHDTRNYNTWISTEQEDKLDDPMTTLFSIIQQNIWGEVKKDFGFKFVSLWQEDPNEKAEREDKQSQTDDRYYIMGVLTAWLIAEALEARGTYTFPEGYVAALKKEEEDANEELGAGNRFGKDGAALPPGEDATKKKSEDEPPASEKDEKAKEK